MVGGMLSPRLYGKLGMLHVLRKMLDDPAYVIIACARYLRIGKSYRQSKGREALRLEWRQPRKCRRRYKAEDMNGLQPSLGLVVSKIFIAHAFLGFYSIASISSLSCWFLSLLFSQFVWSLETIQSRCA